MSTPTAPPRPATLAILAGFAAVYVIWGSTYLAILYAIETLPIFIMAGARFFLAGAILYVYARRRGAARPTVAHWRDACIVGGLLLFISNGGVVWSETRVDSGVAALLIATVPMWMVLLDWLRPRGTRPGAAVVAGLALGTIGIVLLNLPAGLFQSDSPAEASIRVDPLGAAVLVTVSLIWSFGSLYSRRAARPDSALLGAGMQMLAGGALHLLTGSILGEWSDLDPARVSLRSILSVVYLLVFGSIIGFTAYMWLLRVSTPAKVATYAYVNPVVAVALGWLFAGERLDARLGIAAAIIVLGVVVITTARSAPSMQSRASSEASAPIPAALHTLAEPTSSPPAQPQPCPVSSENPSASAPPPRRV